MHPSEQKKVLRDSIKLRLMRLSDKDRAAEARSLCRRILQRLPPPPANVCGYVSLKDEIDIKPLLGELIAKGYDLFLPRYEGKLVFRKADDLEHLMPGKFDIPEPSEDSLLLDPAAPAIALVPGRAFTKRGERMGRGNGGYDIWIREKRNTSPETQFWGVAYEHQIVNDVPMEGHDERVDLVVTARGAEVSKK